jgi:hypothetical protein
MMAETKKNKYGYPFPKKPPDELLTCYLTTWLIMHGKTFITEAQASDLDEMIDDDAEICWSYCLDSGYIYNPQYSNHAHVGDKTKLTKAGIAFINGERQ